MKCLLEFRHCIEGWASVIPKICFLKKRLSVYLELNGNVISERALHYIGIAMHCTVCSVV